MMAASEEFQSHSWCKDAINSPTIPQSDDNTINQDGPLVEDYRNNNVNQMMMGGEVRGLL